MLIPYNTDAPIYHLPIVTVVLIVVNVAVFLAMYLGALSEEQAEYWVLSYGDGLHPVQWVLSNFTHGDIMHLVGNMVFLWSFGLVIEGKLGWWKFLLVYFAIGVGECAIEQTLMLGAEPRLGGSFGASSAIYGLLAMSLVWAPRNDISCLLFFQYIPRQVEVPILTFGCLYIGLQVGVMMLLDEFSLKSAALHLIGAALGGAIGVVLLKTGLVDCEGWDVFAVLAGREGSTVHLRQQLAEKEKIRKDRRKHADKLPSGAGTGHAKSPAQPAVVPGAGEQIALYLQQNNIAAALTLYKKLGGASGSVALEEKQLGALIQGALKLERWSDSVPLMVAYLKQYPEKSMRMRLKLAEVLIHHEKRPEMAQRVLAKLPANGLPEPLQAARRKLEQAAKQLTDDAELEIEGNEDW